MEDILKDHYCAHAIILDGMNMPVYAVLMKIGDMSQSMVAFEPKANNTLARMKEDSDIPTKDGVCLNELLDILQFDAELCDRDLVIVTKCPCEN